MNHPETDVPTIHVSPDNRSIIGYQPIYGPAGPQPTQPAQPLPSGFNAGLLVASAALSGALVWMAAGSYYGARSIETAQDKANAAIALAQQYQTELQHQTNTIEQARKVLGCVPGGAQ